MFGLDPDTIRNIKTAFSELPQIEKVILYGSRAKGNYKKGSDIDITLLGKNLNLQTIYQLDDKLDELYLPYTFDISIFNQIDNLDLIDHIKRVGKVFYIKKSGLPQGWEVKKLGEICTVIAGQSPEGKYYNTEQNGLPFYQGKKEFTAKYLGNPTKWTSKITKEAIENDILMAVRAPVGPVNFSTQKICIGRGLAAIRANGEINKEYLYNFLVKHESELTGNTGAVFNSISKSQIEAIEIPIPPLLEQKRIVAILDKAFTAIDKAKANAEKNLANAKELFESYLNVIFANPGEDWEEKTLEQISETFGRGKSKHRPRNDKKLYGGDYPFIQTGDIRNCEHLITDYSQSYNNEGLAQSKLWPTGTICITIAANIAETGVLTFDACFPDSVIGVVVNKKQATIDFVEYLLQSFKANLQSLGKGSAQDNINMGTFKDKLFPFPPIEEQKIIVNKFDALSVEIKQLESIYHKKIAELEELKKSILQKAFVGKL